MVNECLMPDTKKMLVSMVGKCDTGTISAKDIIEKIPECGVMDGAVSGKAEKKKRAPSAFNLFMKECLKRTKETEGDHKHHFTMCVHEWKSKKK